ncbi:MAG: hypothetical protein WC822_07195 [Candidatus Paceibacterota bacterium]|jgi:hypothetical protein
MLKTKGGWSAEWKHGTHGTNLSPTVSQRSTWYLWGYSPRGSQSIIATVQKIGGKYEVRNSMRGGLLVGSFNTIKRSKSVAEKLAGIS